MKRHSSSLQQQQQSQSSLPTFLSLSWTTVAAATIIGTSSYYIYRLLSQHGWDGTLRLLWEGSPYPPELRGPYEALDDAANVSTTLQQTIQTLEKGLEEAQIAEESNFSSILRQWQLNVQSSLTNDDLRQHLALLSHELDHVAAQVDGVLSENGGVKQRKKDLSQRLVTLMERADALISFYTKASSPVIVSAVSILDGTF
jgi:hypothetical protein